MADLFPLFSPNIIDYPAKKLEILFPFNSTPTNSWSQNSIANNISDDNMFTNPIPWYVTPSYTHKTIGLSHTESVGFTYDITQGNKRIQEDTSSTFLFGGGKFIAFTNIDDLTCRYIVYFTEDLLSSMQAYISRGNILSTFEYDNAPINIDIIGTVINFIKINNFIYNLTIAENISTLVSISMVKSENTLIVNDLSFYDRNINLNIPISVIYKGVDIIVNTMDTEIKITATTYIITKNNGFDINVNIDTNTNVPTINLIKDNINYSITVDIDPKSNPQKVFSRRSVIKNTDYIIYSLTDLKLNNNSIKSIENNYSGIIQIAKKSKMDFSNYYGNYITKGLIDKYSDNSYNISFNKIGNKVLILLPNHWNLSNIIGMNKLIQTEENFIYGDMTYYEIFQNEVTINLPIIIIDELPILKYNNGNDFDENDKLLLTDKVKIDAKCIMDSINHPATNSSSIKVLPVNSNPYNFGTSALAASRILYFSKLLNCKDNYINDLKDIMIKYLKMWLDGTNSTSQDNIYQLQYDMIWRGIVVPADYTDKLVNNPNKGSSYGNSYYNDHHFHWGYLLYCIYIMSKIDNTLKLLDIYKDKIISIMKDVVNPQSDDFAWKTRHKDWYSGHSWATGLTNELNRQQESSSEAVNCYYSCYLISKYYNKLELRESTSNKIYEIMESSALLELTNCSKICLQLEILASKQYYRLEAPGSDYKVLSDVKTIGIMQTFGKSFTLDWAMDPPTFPGRSIGIHGIQCVPFTEITKELITNEWVSKLITPKDSIYSIPPELIVGLCSNIYNEIIPSSGQPPSDINNTVYNANLAGSIWGTVGLQILTLGNGINNIDVQNAYNSTLDKINGINTNLPVYQMKEFDSLTNVLYFGIKYGKWDNFGKSTIIFNNNSILIPKTSNNNNTIYSINDISAINSINDKIDIINKELVQLGLGKFCHIRVPSCYSIEIIIELNKNLDNPLNMKISSVIKKSKKCNKCNNSNVLITFDISNINYYIIGDEKSSFFDKSNILQVSGYDLLYYSTLKLALMYYITKKFDINYLLNSNNEYVISTIKNSKYKCLLNNIDQSYIIYFK